MPQGVETDVMLIGVGFPECHAQTPWSSRRWSFVTDGLLHRTPRLWWGNVPQIAQALQGARSVGWQADAHGEIAFEKLQALLKAGHSQPVLTSYPQPGLFAPVALYCESFTQWWRHTKIVL